jgi:hypothetical protein
MCIEWRGFTCAVPSFLPLVLALWLRRWSGSTTEKVHDNGGVEQGKVLCFWCVFNLNLPYIASVLRGRHPIAIWSLGRPDLCPCGCLR